MGRPGGTVLVPAASVVAVLSGIAVLFAILVGQTFERADAGEQATDLVRSELSPDGLRRHRADLVLVEDAFEQFEEAMPSFAAALQLDAAAFEQQVEAEYPAIAGVLDGEARAEGLQFADGIISNLEAHEADFAEADAIPVSWLPMTAGPWIGSLLAAGLIGAGVWALVRPGAGPLLVAGGLALLAIVGPLAVRFPQKAHAADRLLDTLNVTPAIAADTRDLLEGVRDAHDEMEEGLFPALAQSLRVSPQAFDAAIEDQFPALARGRAEFDDLFERYERRVVIRESGLDVVPKAKQFPLQSVVWWSVVPGAVTLLAVGAALLARRASGSGR